MSKQENETIIELRAVSKSYGLGDAESKALNKFDLTVKRGEFIMIMGPSGCGKTTLLNIIGLLDKPTEGTYFLHGKAASRISARKKAHFRAEEIGFIFQSFNLIPTLSVIENVSLPLVYNGVGKTRRLKSADNILERFHLRQREYYMPYQLSGGQQQRVAIARSLISKPSIILADEPTGNLDSRSSHIIMEELRNIHSQGNTIIMVTHNPDLTAYATRVINMLDGEIDTDIKTVADHNLPQGRSPYEPEKIAVRVLSRKRPPEIAVDSKTPVMVSGENIQVTGQQNANPARQTGTVERRTLTLKRRDDMHNSPYIAKPATAKDAPKPGNTATPAATNASTKSNTAKEAVKDSKKDKKDKKAKKAEKAKKAKEAKEAKKSKDAKKSKAKGKEA